MTAPFDVLPEGSGAREQWADCGVNVGRNVYGGIHIHPAASANPGPADRQRRAGLIRAARYASARSRLAALSHACARATAAMSALGPARPDGRQR
ncbi:hypothetical protein ACH47Z_22675 [Streptomyces sp. NPDC020192]|uniref:hypothetical protein n=1 Tax=Streptomyces sp. NPDC020192 TaxID=3365066 RepID=UPI0037AA4C45